MEDAPFLLQLRQDPVCYVFRFVLRQFGLQLLIHFYGSRAYYRVNDLRITEKPVHLEHLLERGNLVAAFPGIEGGLRYTELCGCLCLRPMFSVAAVADGEGNVF